MDVLRVMRVAVAHWVVTLGVLVLAVLSAVGIALLINPTYQAQSSVILLGPSTTEDTGSAVRVNPYSRSGVSGEGLMAASVISILNSDQGQNALAGQGFVGTYKIALDPGGSGAIIDLTVLSTSSENAVAGTNLLQKFVGEQIYALQMKAGAPSSSLVRVEPLLQLDRPMPVLSGRLKVGGAVFIAGFIIALTTAHIAERRHPRLAPRKAGGAAADAEQPQLVAEQAPAEVLGPVAPAELAAPVAPLAALNPTTRANGAVANGSAQPSEVRSGLAPTPLRMYMAGSASQAGLTSTLTPPHATPTAESSPSESAVAPQSAGRPDVVSPGAPIGAGGPDSSAAGPAPEAPSVPAARGRWLLGRGKGQDEARPEPVEPASPGEADPGSAGRLLQDWNDLISAPLEGDRTDPAGGRAASRHVRDLGGGTARP